MAGGDATGVTVSEALRLLPPSATVTSPAVPAVTTLVVMAIRKELLPAGMVAIAGTSTIEVVEERATVRPPAGATPFNAI